MKRWREDPHTLAGAYALDALPVADRIRFERHLASCDACRQEADSLREAAARLAAAAAVEPPPALRGPVLAAAARTRQTPGLSAGRGADARGGRAERGMTPLLAPRLASAVAGMAILIALGLGALTLNARHRYAQEQARGRAIAAVLTAPDATMLSAQGVKSGMARVVMSHQRRAVILATDSLPALPAGDRYEVWVMGPGGVRPAGMLPPPHGGMTSPMIVAGVSPGERIGVTMEPAAGTPRPTAPPVLMVNLPSS